MYRKIQLVFVFLLFATCSFSQNRVNGNTIIVHTIEDGQTVYSIANLYSVEPEEIKKQNPSIDSTYAIKPGQILKIELSKKQESTAHLNKLNREPIFHRVEDEQTLYSISKTYGVSVNTLQEWNKLDSNAIDIGQKLKVGWKYSNQPEKEQPEKTTVLNKPTPKVEKKQVDQVKVTETKTIESRTVAPAVTRKPNYFTNNKQNVLQQRFVSDYSTKNKHSEDGPAIWFETENKMMRENYYGLFSEAPVGSVVRVTNLRNNRRVYVKIIGNLPKTGENYGSMIKLTLAVKKALHTVDGKIRVRVDYAK